MSRIVQLCPKSSNAYEPSEFEACVVAKNGISGIIAVGAIIGITAGISYLISEQCCN